MSQGKILTTIMHKDSLKTGHTVLPKITYEDNEFKIEKLKGQIPVLENDHFLLNIDKYMQL